MNRPNVILIVLDTVRARNLSCYGYKRETTPNLEAMDLVRFDDAFAPANATVPSHASLFTGSYRSIHQTTSDNKILNPDLPTLAERLSANGYRTLGFSNNIHVSSLFQFDRGFDELEFNKGAYGEPFGGVPVQLIRQHIEGDTVPERIGEIVQYIRDSDGSFPRTTASWLYKKATEVSLVDRGDRGAQKAHEYLDSSLPSDDQPFFMFFNLMEGHMPFLAPDEYLNRFDPDVARNIWGDYDGLHERTVQDSDRIVGGLLDKYDGCISYLDAVVDRMVNVLRERDVLDDTYLFILGDHGEAFGEHGIYGHTGGLYNEITRVPLLVRPPGGADKKSIDRPVSIQWIMPTILREVGIDIPDRCVDQHLFERPEVPVVFESSGLGIDADHPDIEQYFEEMIGGIHGERKLIAGETWEELYALSDRTETEPLSESQEVGEVIEAAIARYDPTDRSEGYSDQELPSETQEQLRKLGYME